MPKSALNVSFDLIRVHARDLTIRLGEYDFNEKENSRRQDYGVARIVRHPAFNETNNNYADIALIKVNKDVSSAYRRLHA